MASKFSQSHGHHHHENQSQRNILQPKRLNNSVVRSETGGSRRILSQKAQQNHQNQSRNNILSNLALAGGGNFLRDISIGSPIDFVQASQSPSQGISLPVGLCASNDSNNNGSTATTTTTNNNNNNSMVLGGSLPISTPGKKGPNTMAKRNARERNRVKLVNQGFQTLRQHIPEDYRLKKMSKVDTLRCALDYIRSMEEILQIPGDLQETNNTCSYQGFSSEDMSQHLDKICHAIDQDASSMSMSMDDTEHSFTFSDEPEMEEETPASISIKSNSIVLKQEPCSPSYGQHREDCDCDCEDEEDSGTTTTATTRASDPRDLIGRSNNDNCNSFSSSIRNPLSHATTNSIPIQLILSHSQSHGHGSFVQSNNLDSAQDPLCSDNNENFHESEPNYIHHTVETMAHL